MLNIVLAYLMLFFFLIICSHPCCCCCFFIYIFLWKAMSSPEKWHLKVTIIIIIIIKEWRQGLKEKCMFAGLLTLYWRLVWWQLGWGCLSQGGREGCWQERESQLRPEDCDRVYFVGEIECFSNPFSLGVVFLGCRGHGDDHPLTKDGPLID